MTDAPSNSQGHGAQWPTPDPDAVALVKPYRAFISATPALLSLLYDADLLPEQIVSMRGAVSLAAVCEAYKIGIAQGLVRDGSSQQGKAND